MRQAGIFACYVVATLALGVLVLVGYALSWLYRGECPDEHAAWNCWSFAVPKWLQDPVRSGLLISCSAHLKAIPHVRFVPSVAGVDYEEAVPENPRKGWRAVFDSVKFKARIRTNKC